MVQETDGRRRRYEHRRPELLVAAAEHVLEHGLASLSLRRVAEAVGVSHATLVHHFATRERLVAEIVDLVLTQTLSEPGLWSAEGTDPLRALWENATSERGLRYVRLFVAITGHSLHGEPELARAVRRSVEERTALLAAALVRRGHPEAGAPARATLVMALLRGLLVDLLVTGDRPRVDAAFELLAADLGARRAQLS